MKMTVLDVPVRELERHPERLTRAIEAETALAWAPALRTAATIECWMRLGVSPVTKQNKDRAWSQLGTSGSGNHFVEFGLFTAHGQFMAWSGHLPRAVVAQRQPWNRCRRLRSLQQTGVQPVPDLPSELKRLAWLSLDSPEGQEYWAAMELMGRYAAANHALIHKHVAANLGPKSCWTWRTTTTSPGKRNT
jgi:tRNA-splicing ligase RtcB